MKLAALVLGGISLAIKLYSEKQVADNLAATLVELEDEGGIPKPKSYDFVVVGGGSAGCLVAGRLSEKFNVLLLEAGGDPVPQSQVPYFTPEVHADEISNYFFPSVPQANANLANGGIITVNTGKMLGGSSSHNDMVHNRGNPRDYDQYATITGDNSWNYANMLQYFKKAETFIGQLINPAESDLYGTDGPLTVDTEIPLILSKWFEAGQELGFKAGDPNGNQTESFTPMAKLIKKGQRESTYNAYIKPIRDTRQNLTVITYAVASQVLIDRSNNAYGVAYTRHGIPQIAYASKEVIVSTGSLVSPVLLMQSGIGPSSVLQEAGIPVKVNKATVGANLYDHVFLWLNPITFNSSAAPYIPRVPEAEFENTLKRYYETGEGVFAQLQEGPQALFVSSRAKAAGETEWPDNRLVFDASCPTAFDDSEDLSACFWITLDRPKSKGSITLNTTAYKQGETDFTKLAVIDFKMLEDPSDLEVLVDTIKMGLRIIEETTPFQQIGAKYAATQDPRCSQYIFRSDDYWRCYIKQYSDTSLHMVGTCAMGSTSASVTDSKFRVNGVTGLRVIDASILPLTPNSNLNSPVIGLAEKGADEILKSW